MTDEASELAQFPYEVIIDPATVEALVAEGGTVLVVLDDDPTGTQSVSGLPVLTTWDESDLEWALTQNCPAVYVLTNTRSLAPETAALRNREIVTNAIAASANTGVHIAFVSRSDSTLRGHYPLETDVIAQTIAEHGGRAVDGVIIVPAFPEAGRVTIGGIHYMRGEHGLTPVAETEYANDASFGYANSRLSDWVSEKSHGRYAASDVIVLDLGVIRSGTAAIVTALAAASGQTPVVADIVTENDLRALSLGLIAAEAAGQHFLYRVGPPFVRARVGQRVSEPLTASDVFGPEGSDAAGGLIVVGSHVGVTTRQLDTLRLARPAVRSLELDIALILDPATADAHIVKIAETAALALADGDVVVHTSRLLRTAGDAASSLDISRRVSTAVVRVVQLVLAARPPRFVIAKGGITSSDVATHGLGIGRAIVRGPMLPGIVSLWEPIDGPARGIPFVVFAGNVGTDDSLAAVVATLSRPELVLG